MIENIKKMFIRNEWYNIFCMKIKLIYKVENNLFTLILFFFLIVILEVIIFYYNHNKLLLSLT